MIQHAITTGEKNSQVETGWKGVYRGTPFSPLLRFTDNDPAWNFHHDVHAPVQAVSWYKGASVVSWELNVQNQKNASHMFMEWGLVWVPVWVQMGVVLLCVSIPSPMKFMLSKQWTIHTTETRKNLNFFIAHFIVHSSILEPYVCWPIQNTTNTRTTTIHKVEHCFFYLSFANIQLIIIYGLYYLLDLPSRDNHVFGWDAYQAYSTNKNTTPSKIKHGIASVGLSKELCSDERTGDAKQTTEEWGKTRRRPSHF